MTPRSETSVLIVGGGPVGLALGVALDRLGVDHVIVERQAAPSRHPKARGLTARSMENLRVWGLDGPIRAGSLQPDADDEAVALSWVQHYCESVTGRVLGVTSPEPSVHTPVAKCSVAQDVVEQVLCDAIDGNEHTELRRRSEANDFTEVEDGVLVRVVDLEDGTASEVMTDYLVACDGAASSIRAAAGIDMEGPGTLEHMASYYYKADVSHLPYARRTSSFLVFPDDPDVVGGTILASDHDAVRWLYLQRLADTEQPLLGPEELVELTRKHWGIPDLDVEFVSSLRWRMRAEISTAFRRGRVLLAGDAAHCIPPTGGLGLNTGLQDVQNLAWKLALVTGGLSSDELLDTYEAERRPVATDIMEWSVQNHRRLQSQLPQALRGRGEDLESWHRALLEVERHTHSEAMAMGYVYSSPAVIDAGLPPPPLDRRRYWPSDRPGARFPHMWVDADKSTSTIDWFDTEFVLVCGPNADEWRAAGAQVAAASSIPLAVRVLPWMAAPVTMSAEGAVLVRPDGHVGWHPESSVEDKAAELSKRLAAIAARSSA